MSASSQTAEVAQVEAAVFASSGAGGAELLDAVILNEACRKSAHWRFGTIARHRHADPRAANLVHML